MDKILEMKRDYADKTKALRTFLDGFKDKEMTAEDRQKADTLERELDDLLDSIQREERQQKREQTVPKPPEASRKAEPDAPNVITGGRKEDLDPGIRLARYVKTTLVSQKEGRAFEEVAQRMYPKDTVLQESRSAMGVNTPSDGGVLVPEDFQAEIIPLLREQSSIRSLGAQTVPMPNGNLKIPRQTGAANFMWVGENKPILSSKVALGMINLSAKKLAGMIPASNDLLRSSAVSADQFIRNELVNGIAEAEDITAIYGAGTQDSPIGILKAAGDIADLGALPDSDTLGNIVGSVMAKKFPNKTAFGWVFSGILWSNFYNLKDGVGNYIHRQEMQQGKLLGFNFAINNNFTVGTDSHAMTTIVFGDFSQFLVGETLGLQIAVSQEATYMDGGSMVSAFANDQTVMRALLQEDFGVRYADAFVVRNKVWTK